MSEQKHKWLGFKWTHYWRIDEDGHADCGIFYEPYHGQAYALLRAPKYYTHEDWNELAEYVCKSVATHDPLVRALEAFVDACDKAPPLELMAHINAACVKARAALLLVRGKT